MDLFPEALAYTLKNEGGYTVDHAGATNFGITLPILAAFRGTEVTDDDLAAITDEEIKKLYRKIFWDFLRLGDVKAQAIATAVFDTAVNKGPAKAMEMAQTVLKSVWPAVHIDGLMGPVTLDYINSCGPHLFVTKFVQCWLAETEELCQTRPELEKFKKGWDNRAQRLLTLI